MTLADLAVDQRGVLETVADRTDRGEDDVLAFFEHVGTRGLYELLDEDAVTVSLYFEALYDDGSDAALEVVGGDSGYAKTVGRAIDRVEDAFAEWLEESRLLAPLPRTPRRRLSHLAERTA